MIHDSEYGRSRPKGRQQENWCWNLIQEAYVYSRAAVRKHSSTTTLYCLLAVWPTVDQKGAGCSVDPLETAYSMMFWGQFGELRSEWGLVDGAGLGCQTAPINVRSMVFGSRCCEHCGQGGGGSLSTHCTIHSSVQPSITTQQLTNNNSAIHADDEYCTRNKERSPHSHNMHRVCCAYRPIPITLNASK